MYIPIKLDLIIEKEKDILLKQRDVLFIMMTLSIPKKRYSYLGLDKNS